jgi:hypothetical protein
MRCLRRIFWTSGGTREGTMRRPAVCEYGEECLSGQSTWLTWKERVIVYRSVLGGLELGGIAWADVAKGAVQGVNGDGARETELGRTFWVFQVVNVSAEQILGLRPGKSLPLAPELIRRLLVSIKVFDVHCHFDCFVRSSLANLKVAKK